jgi:hypothetical protein
VTFCVASGYGLLEGTCILRLKMEEATYTYPSETLTITYQSVLCHPANHKLKQIIFPTKWSRSTNLYTNFPPSKIAYFYRICVFYVDTTF